MRHAGLLSIILPLAFVPAAAFAQEVGVRNAAAALVALQADDDPAKSIPSSDQAGAKDAATYTFRGYAWARKNDIDKAIADFSEAIRRDPKYSYAYLGRGWAWDDYNDDYSAERSAFPIYMNMIRWVQDRPKGSSNDPFGSSPSIYSIPDVDWPVHFNPDTARKNFFVHRSLNENIFEVTEGKGDHKEQYTPFITDGLASAAILLKDTAGNPAGVRHFGARLPADWSVLRSRPVDSLFRPMMYNSDNFFAEQTLLMVGNEALGSMNDARTIDYLLTGVLDSLPQKPNWVDGCGLSRNDLFTPQDFVWLLNRLQREFGLARMERLLPTGGTGTLLAYYHQDSTFIYAKTGSLSGVAALSGYLITKSGRMLLFSVLINNYSGSGTAVRRQIEKMIHRVRDTY